MRRHRRSRLAASAAIVAVLSTTLVVIEARPASAADGAPDPTFNDGKAVVTDLNLGPDRAIDMARDPLGRIVVISAANGGDGPPYIQDAGPGDIVASRLLPDGTLDPAFGVRGRVRVVLPQTPTTPRAGGVDALGRVVIAGDGDSSDAGARVVRLLTDGTRDPTFGTNGVAALVPPNPDAMFGFVAGMLISPDGNVLVVVGFQAPVGTPRAAIVRLLPNGTPDPTFGVQGFSALSPENFFPSRRLVADNLGRIVLTGQLSSHPALMRLLPNGILDPTFGVGGVASSPAVGDRMAWYSGVVARPDGSVVASGAVETSGGVRSSILVERFSSLGVLDPTFGQGGTAATPATAMLERSRDLAIDGQGRLVVSAMSGSYPNPTDTLTLRLTPSGVLDPSFGTGGRALVPGLVGATAVTLLGDGAVLGAGTAHHDTTVMRLTNAGSVDPGFGDAGIVRFNTGWGAPDHIRAIDLQPDGRIVVAGDDGDDLMLARFLSDGRLDPSFGDGGSEAIDLGGSRETATGVRAMPDGRIVAAGYNDDCCPGDQEIVVRTLPNGAPDPTFGSQGVVELPQSTSERTMSLALLGDGRIVTAGGAGGPTPDQPSPVLVRRFRVDGSLDPTFGDGGEARSAVGGHSASAEAVAVQTDGAVVVAGYSEDTSNPIALLRFLPDGSPDPQFTPFTASTLGRPALGRAHGVVLQPDGRIVVAGGYPAWPGKSAVARFLPSGLPDPTFAGGAAAVAPNLYWGYDNPLMGVALQADGRIVACGLRLDTSSNNGRAAAVRLLPDGTADPSFGDGGVTAPLVTSGPAMETATAIAVSSTRVVIAGSTLLAADEALLGAFAVGPQVPVPPVRHGGFTLDAWGGIHPFGGAAPVTGTGWWPGLDMAAGIAVSGQDQGYTLDAWGGIHEFGGAPPVTSTGWWPGLDMARGIAATGPGQGYTLDAWGGIHPFGSAAPASSTGWWPGLDMGRGIATTASGQGYTLDAWGGIHEFGGAPPVTSTGWWPGVDMARGITTTGPGQGYTVDAWGGIHPFGGAPPVTGTGWWPGLDMARGITTTGPGQGYTVDAWGGIHPFGGATLASTTGWWPGLDMARGVGH